MARPRTIIRRALAAIAGVLLVAGAGLFATRATVAKLPPLRNGDIVFQTSYAVQSFAIALTSESVYSHMGIIEFGADGLPYVVEASTKVRTVPLQGWLNRGVAGRVTVKRIASLAPDAAQKVLAAAHVYDGLPYDMYFTFGKDSMYCSEHVRLAFDEGAGIVLGTLQTAGTLNIDNFAARRLIRQRWTGNPVCTPQIESFEDCYAKILKQELVTPVSIARDAKLETIYSNFGPFGD